MDESQQKLIEHGVLGAIIVFEAGIIAYLFAEVRRLTDRIIDLVDRTDQIVAQLEIPPEK